jgi:large repetitive protein
VGPKRFFLVVVVAAFAALAVTSSAPAGDFADEPCLDASGPDTATCPTGTTGTPYSVTIKPKEGAGCGAASPQVWTVSSGSIPPGLTFSSNGTAGAQISGIPTEAGNFTFYITVLNPYKEDPPGTVVCNGDFSDKKFTIPIVPGLPKLTLGPETTTPATVGAPYSLQMTATVAEPKIWSISSGALPPGLAIDASTGLITGTPTAAGEFGFTVFARMNSDARTDTKALAIVVRDPLSILATEPFTQARRAPSEVSVAFEAQFTATGGTGAYTWSLTSGELPPGLALSDGTIAGKPTTAGAYRFTATVTDSEGRVANYPARIIVAAKLSISTLLLRRAKLGRYYQAKVNTAGGVLPRTWRIVRGPLPRGIRFDRTVGLLYGIPTRPGRFRVTFVAADALGVKAKKTLSIVVAK